jgi:hypothetical protein
MLKMKLGHGLESQFRMITRSHEGWALLHDTI